jgi:hypothetical protein
MLPPYRRLLIELVISLPSLALSNRHLVHRWFRCKLVMLVQTQSDPLLFGYLSVQHLGRHYHLIYACDDVYDGVYVCDGFQVELKLLRQVCNTHFLQLILDVHYIWVKFYNLVLHLLQDHQVIHFLHRVV